MPRRRSSRKIDGFTPGTFDFQIRYVSDRSADLKGGLNMCETGETAGDRGHYDRTNSATGKLFGDIANRTSQAAGRALTFMIASGIVIIWAITGPFFHYSDTWQLVINTGTTIVTFLMVFLIQNSQNRDSAAIQVKLDELIRVSAVHNSFVGIEHLTDHELDEIRSKCERRAEAEKVADETVKNTRKKARRAADLVTE
jgi:low affinity Fe/Cu permease